MTKTSYDQLDEWFDTLTLDQRHLARLLILSWILDDVPPAVFTEALASAKRTIEAERILLQSPPV